MNENTSCTLQNNSLCISSILSDSSCLNQKYLNSTTKQTNNRLQSTVIELKSMQQIDSSKVDTELSVKLNKAFVDLGYASIMFDSNHSTEIDFIQLIKNCSNLIKNYRQNLSRIEKFQDE